MHLVNLLNEFGWITVYVPNALYWIGGYFHYDKSKNEIGMYDQPELAVHFLSSIYELNSKKLKEIPTNPANCIQPASNVAELIEAAMKPENLNLSIPITKSVLEHLGNQTQYECFPYSIVDFGFLLVSTKLMPFLK